MHFKCTLRSNSVKYIFLHNIHVECLCNYYLIQNSNQFIERMQLVATVSQTLSQNDSNS